MPHQRTDLRIIINTIWDPRPRDKTTPNLSFFQVAIILSAI